MTIGPFSRVLRILAAMVAALLATVALQVFTAGAAAAQGEGTQDVTVGFTVADADTLYSVANVRGESLARLQDTAIAVHHFLLGISGKVGPPYRCNEGFAEWTDGVTGPYYVTSNSRSDSVRIIREEYCMTASEAGKSSVSLLAFLQSTVTAVPPVEVLPPPGTTDIWVGCEERLDDATCESAALVTDELVADAWDPSGCPDGVHCLAPISAAWQLPDGTPKRTFTYCVDKWPTSMTRDVASQILASGVAYWQQVQDPSGAPILQFFPTLDKNRCDIHIEWYTRRERTSDNEQAFPDAPALPGGVVLPDATGRAIRESGTSYFDTIHLLDDVQLIGQQRLFDVVDGRFVFCNTFPHCWRNGTQPSPDSIFAHELGHALGLGHAADSSGVMFTPAPFTLPTGPTDEEWDVVSGLYWLIDANPATTPFRSTILEADADSGDDVAYGWLQQYPGSPGHPLCFITKSWTSDEDLGWTCRADRFGDWWRFTLETRDGGAGSPGGIEAKAIVLNPDFFTAGYGPWFEFADDPDSLTWTTTAAPANGVIVPHINYYLPAEDDDMAFWTGTSPAVSVQPSVTSYQVYSHLDDLGNDDGAALVSWVSIGPVPGSGAEIMFDHGGVGNGTNQRVSTFPLVGYSNVEFGSFPFGVDPNGGDQFDWAITTTAEAMSTPGCGGGPGVCVTTNVQAANGNGGSNIYTGTVVFLVR